jgi:hypothetical protein
MKQFKSRMISNSNLNIIPRSYSSEVLIQQEVRFSDCFLVRSTVSVYKHSFLSARVSSLSQCWTAVANASCTLLAFFADVSMLAEIPFSPHQVSISTWDTSRSFASTSDCKFVN